MSTLQTSQWLSQSKTNDDKRFIISSIPEDSTTEQDRKKENHQIKDKCIGNAKSKIELLDVDEFNWWWWWHITNMIGSIKALWLMVAWCPFSSYNCCDFSCGLHKWADHSFSICPPFLCNGNVQHFIYSEFHAADCAQSVKNDLEILL